MSLPFTVAAFLLALGPLVIFHELGHYLVARLCGVKVLRFSVGMGKVIWSRRFGADQTEWAVSVLPLGGYVKMLDSRDPEAAPADPSEYHREFTRKSVWKRIAIVAAGPLANFALAIALLAGLFMHGVEEPAARLGSLAAASAAYQAGVRAGDRVSAVNGRAVASWGELNFEIMRAAVDKTGALLDVAAAGGGSYRATLPASALAAVDVDGDVTGHLGLRPWTAPGTIGQVLPGGAAARAGLRAGDVVRAVDGAASGAALSEIVAGAPGRTLQLQVQRGAATLTLPVTPERDAGGRGRIGVMVSPALEMVTVSSGPLAALAKGAARTWDMSTMQVRLIGKMIVGQLSWRNVSGPLTIADYAGQSARRGAISYLQFIAFISIALGVMNLLPIPVLDGGHLLYYSLEVLTGRPLPERIGEMAQRAGVGLLFMLMALAVFNDLVRLL